MNRQILQEAAEWFVEFNTGNPDLAVRRRFDAWLRSSPENVRAFLEMMPTWEDGSAVPGEVAPTPEKLIDWARAGTNVVAIEAAEPTQRATDRAARSRRGGLSSWRALAASVALLVVSAVLVWGYQRLLSSTYTTGVGEQHSLALADGSTIQLNACSKIRVRYSARERRVELVEGQALFQVAKDPNRPFIVRSDQAQVRAVGTQFDVYRKTAGTVVTVVEGEVAVYSSATGQPVPALASDRERRAPSDVSELVAAGEQLMVTDRTMQRNRHPNVTGVTAWTQHQLVFDRASLTDVAREFNRYNARRLLIDAPGLTGFQISGIFSSTDPASLLRFLREQPGIRVVESDQEIRVSHD